MKDREPKADSANTGNKGTADSSKNRIPTRHVLARAKKNSIRLGLAPGSLQLPCLQRMRE